MRQGLYITVAAVAALLLAAGCGNDIGDSCTIASDCSPRGDRICDRNSPNGYCTVLGCDHDTCPDDSVCVRFFPSAQTTLACSGDQDCTPDELCSLTGYCAPRAAERRYCMKTCGGNGDCRDQYECRDQPLMLEHGGEPVLAPGADTSSLPNFCATAPL